MGDLMQDTEIEGGAGRYRGTISQDWEGFNSVPVGGYLAAMMLRAAGKESGLPRPVSFSCQFVRAANLSDEAELRVETLRSTKRTAALRVSLYQGSNVVVDGHVWTAVDDLPGYDFDAHPPDVKARPGDWDRVEEHTNMPLARALQNLESRWDHIDPGEPGAHSEPYSHGWHRFQPKAVYGDPYVDAGRLLFIADARAFGPVAFHANVGPIQVPFFAPNMDLSVQFCRDSSRSEWLLCTARAITASRGMVTTRMDLWSEEGHPVAMATSTLVCRTNPFAT